MVREGGGRGRKGGGEEEEGGGRDAEGEKVKTEMGHEKGENVAVEKVGETYMEEEDKKERRKEGGTRKIQRKKDGVRTQGTREKEIGRHSGRSGGRGGR